MKISRQSLIILCFIISCFIKGCSKDGENGQAYLSFDWDWYVDGYWDDNPDIPSTIQRNEDYRVKPGTYLFEYECSDGEGDYWGYEGSYTIKINYGEDKTLFKDGADGTDNFYSFFLSGSGNELNVVKKNLTLNKSSINRYLSKGSSRISSSMKVFEGEIIFETFYLGNTIVEVSKQKFVFKN